MKKTIFLISAALCMTLSGYAQDYEDDIYFDPKKAPVVKTENKKKKPAVSVYGEPQVSYYYVQSPYQEERDVDEYNRQGVIHATALDTIGSGIANAEDFLYTQQIQKYYNPTIVVDNASLLADVLDNSYGNVDIVYNNGIPSFSAWSYSPWYSPVYSPWYYPSSYYWYWGPSWNIGWSWGWAGGWYDPWYNPWYPGWGPSWGWGWGGNWAWRPSNPRPSTSLRPGWSAGTRPGVSNHRGTSGMVSAGHSTRPGISGRPGSLDATSGNHRYMGGSHRPTTTIGTRPSSSSARPGWGGVGTRPSNTVNGNQYRPSTRPSSGMTRPSTGTRPSNSTTTRPSYNNNSNNHNRNSGSFNSGTHRGSSSAGGFRSGGGGGGFRGGGGGGGHRR